MSSPDADAASADAAAASADAAAAASAAADPAHPSTVGALLSEELTLDPLSTLPSFWEMALVDAASDGGREAIRAAVRALTERASRAAAAADAAADAGAGAGAAPSGRGALAWAKVRLARLFAALGRRYSPELRLLASYALERSFLMSDRSCGTASESVYGLRRARVEREAEGAGGSDDSGSATATASLALRPPSGGDRIRSAALAAAGPYAKERLDGAYERMRDDARRRRLSRQRRPRLGGGGASNTADKLRSLFVSAYPFLHMTHEGIVALYRFLYLIGRTAYYGPGLHLLGLVVRRTTRADLTPLPASGSAGGGGAPPTGGAGGSGSGAKRGGTAAEAEAAASAPSPLPWARSPSAERALRILRAAAVAGAAAALLAAWTGEWRDELRRRRRRWIAGEDAGGGGGRVGGAAMPSPAEGTGGAAAAAATATGGARGPGATGAGGGGGYVRIPPPLPPPTLPSSSASSDVDAGLCPLCRRPLVNPAASTSGYVFCHRCLVMRLRERGSRCPLTGRACDEGQVVRLYEPGASAAEAGGFRPPSAGR